MADPKKPKASKKRAASPRKAVKPPPAPNPLAYPPGVRMGMLDHSDVQRR